MMRRLAVLAALLLAACAPAAPPLPRTCAIAGLERVGGPVALVDAGGRAVTQADFADRPTLLYFGFANCPAICPTSLQTARAALEARGAHANPLRMAFVTVDPARDTPALLARYVASPGFPPGLVGLTGAQAQIDAATTAFKVYAQRVDDPGSAAGYTFDHSRLFYLMDRQWKTAAIFPDSLAPQDMATCIDAALKARK